MSLGVGQCKICGHDLGQPLLEFKAVPATLHLSSLSGDPESAKVDFEWLQCLKCFHFQQKRNPLLGALRPRYEWQRFREPEEHLDEHARKFRSYLGDDASAHVYGVSWQDESLLGRLRQLGCHCSLLAPFADLGVPDTGECFGIESLQYYFRQEVAHAAVLRRGQADALIVRDVLEHAFQPVDFLRQLSHLVRDEGFLFIEVPGSFELLKRQRYWLLWEHHISYFTQETLRNAVLLAGLTPVSEQQLLLGSGEYLIMVAQKRDQKASLQLDRNSLNSGPGLVEIADLFCNQYPVKHAEVRSKLEGFRKQNQAIYFYGANHVTQWWIRVFEAGPYFSAIVDDMPEKQGLYLPGTGIPIVSSSVLAGASGAVCLHLFGPSAIQKVGERNREFFEKGGIFLNAEYC